MRDQALTLHLLAAPLPLKPRARLNQRPAPTAAPRARIIAVTGGKGGVGKSNVAVNVALALAARGRRVALLDADLALANADVLFGLNPAQHLGHVLAGRCTLADVIVETAGGVRLVPGGSG